MLFLFCVSAYILKVGFKKYVKKKNFKFFFQTRVLSYTFKNVRNQKQKKKHFKLKLFLLIYKNVKLLCYKLLLLVGFVSIASFFDLFVGACWVSKKKNKIN